MATRYKFKAILVGNCSSGKTSILNQFIRNEFSTDYLPTIGIDYSSKVLTLEDDCIRLSFWDSVRFT